MEAAQAPWRALARATRFQGAAAQGYRAPVSRLVPSDGRGVDARRRSGRRRSRRDVRLVETVAENLSLRGFDLWSHEDLYWWVDNDGAQACWHDEWWHPVMPSRAFAQDGLVHMAMHGELHAFCGRYGSPFGVRLDSTDAALAYAARLEIAEDEVTCLECIVEMGYVGFSP